VTVERRVSRRTLLRAGFFSLAGALAAACTLRLPSPSPTSGATGTGTPAASPSSVPLPTGSAAPTPPAAPLRRRIARLLVVGFRGFGVDDAPWLRRAIEDEGLGGVILFDKDGRRQGPRNIESPQQVRRLIADLRRLALDRELIVAIDQEGGKVTRLSDAYGFPAVVSEAAVGTQSEAAVETWADGIATTLASVGVNLNLAPVVDLDVNPDNPSIGAIGRAFSSDPVVVARDAAIEVRAHRQHDVRTTLKHFPGLGSATAHTDLTVADVTDTWSPIELDPYRALLGDGLVDLVMAANVVNGQIDPGVPASLSRATVTGLLRDGLGWDGPVITDDLQAGSITQAFGADDAVRLALEAGNDLLLFANQQVYDRAVVTRILDLVEGLVADGGLSAARIDESVARIDRTFPLGTAAGAG
jgi:beta-N-acetylhexosaminidase